jgi:hypothetical protein
LQSGGSFASGDGTSWGAQRPITIQVGSETVQSVDGELASRPNVNRDWAQAVLEQQKNNPLFRPREPSADDTAFARVKPIYETRVQYIDQSEFLGSEYFLDKIGYDPQKSVTVLGDAYFDNQLILQSVQQRLGNFFAQTQRLSDADLVQRLMNNGAELFVESGFTLGQPLTPAQIAGLKNDVVWYENQLVDGQLVLAPRLYLSQQTLAARDQDASGSALVGADTLLIDAESVANINGTIRGSTDTFIYSKTDINNVSVGGTQAGIFAGQGGKEKAGQLVIAAEGKVLNQGGIMSGFQQTVVGGEGVTSSATTGYDKNGYLVVRDNGVLGSGLSGIEPKKEPQPELAQPEIPASKKSVEAPDVRAIFEERLAAGPVDASQGSSLSIISGGDINLTGAITQSDNVLLQTTGDLNMRDLHEARSAFDSVGQTGFLSQVDITEMASSANSVGNTLNAKNLVVKTAGNWAITGGEINTETSAVEVGGDMTVAAGKDLAFHEKTVKTVQLVIGGGIGAGGYEANAMWGSAANVDTQLASPFDGQGDETSSVRSHASAGRSASSQALATEGTGGRTGANKGRGATSGANVKIGLEMVTTTDTTESSTYRNAQLNLGSGSVDVGGTFDFGGADINAGFQLSPEERAKMTAQERIAATEAMPTLDIKAGDIKTTKYESTEKTSHSREELFFGFTAEAHSSLADVATQVANTAHKAMGTDAVNDPNAPAGSSKTQAMSEGKMEIDPALTAVAAAGLATQVAFGEVIGASRTLGMQHTKENRESESRAENINQVGGNISLTSTQGDIALNGVNLQGGKVAIKSAGALTQQAAKSSSSSKESVTTHRVGISDSIGVSPTGAGMGMSVGADGSYDETKTRSTSYQNGLISGTEVSIETAGDHTMIGSNIKGNQVTAKIGGNQTITSVQDTSTMDHTRGNWSASVGIAITTNGLIQGTGSFSASGGKDFDNSKLVAEQAGISADSLSLDVAKNLNLTGAHITSKQGSVDVGGKITAQTLHDSREKDGGYGGGGAGISKNGLPSATFEFGRVDQVKYHADNAATIDVGDSSNVKAAEGISGKINTDASKQLNVTQNKRVAGTEVKIEVSISDAQEIKDGVKKLVGPKSAGSKPIADAPSSRPRTSETRKTKTADPKPAYDQRVIVNTDTSNPIVNRAVQNLANKHPDTSVVITPTVDGGHRILQGALAAGASTKVDVVGHAREGSSLGGLSGKQIIDVLQNLKADSGAQLDKIALVGCGTSCAKDGNSLVNEVSGLLQQQGAGTQVKGYETPIRVDDQGHKQPVLAQAPQALGKGDNDPGDARPGDASAQNTVPSAAPVPFNPKRRWLAQAQAEQAAGTAQPQGSLADFSVIERQAAGSSGFDVSRSRRSASETRQGLNQWAGITTDHTDKAAAMAYLKSLKLRDTRAFNGLFKALQRSGGRPLADPDEVARLYQQLPVEEKMATTLEKFGREHGVNKVQMNTRVSKSGALKFTVGAAREGGAGNLPPVPTKFSQVFSDWLRVTSDHGDKVGAFTYLADHGVRNFSTFEAMFGPYQRNEQGKSAFSMAAQFNQLPAAQRKTLKRFARDNGFDVEQLRYFVRRDGSWKKGPYATTPTGAASKAPAPDLPPAAVSPLPVGDAYIDVHAPPLISLDSDDDSAGPPVASATAGLFRPGIKEEPVTSPRVSPAPTPEPMIADAPVKEEVPPLRHAINNAAPVLQGPDGEDVLLQVLQPPQRAKRTNDVNELIDRQKITDGFVFETAIAKANTATGLLSPSGIRQAAKRAKQDATEMARDLLKMTGEQRAAFMESWMKEVPVPDLGMGAFAVRDIPAYQVLAPYSGRFVVSDKRIAQERAKLGRLQFDAYSFATQSERMLISAFGDGVGNITTRINEGKSGSDTDNNVSAIVLGRKIPFIVSTRPVAAGEQLLFAYGPEYDRSGWPSQPLQVGDNSDSQESATESGRDSPMSPQPPRLRAASPDDGESQPKRRRLTGLGGRAESPMDVSEMDFGPLRLWIKTEPVEAPSPEHAAEPVQMEASVKQEVPTITHVIDNAGPVLQGDNGEDMLLRALQAGGKHKPSRDLNTLLERQKLYLRPELNEELSATLPPSRMVDVRKNVAATARDLLKMPAEQRAAYMESLMQVTDSPEKGRGVIARRDIQAYEVLGPYAGKWLVGAEQQQAEENRIGDRHTMANYLFQTLSKDTVISAYGDKLGNVTSLINDGDADANNNVDYLRLGRNLVFYLARRPIRAGEELLVDYGPDYDRSGWGKHPIPVSSGSSSEDSGSEASERPVRPATNEPQRVAQTPDRAPELPVELAPSPPSPLHTAPSPVLPNYGLAGTMLAVDRVTPAPVGSVAPKQGAEGDADNRAQVHVNVTAGTEPRIQPSIEASLPLLDELLEPPPQKPSAHTLLGKWILETNNLSDKEGAWYSIWKEGGRVKYVPGFDVAFNSLQKIPRGEGGYAAALEYAALPAAQRNAKSLANFAKEKRVSVNTVLTWISTKGVWKKGSVAVHEKLATFLPVKQVLPASTVTQASDGSASSSAPRAPAPHHDLATALPHSVPSQTQPVPAGEAPPKGQGPSASRNPYISAEKDALDDWVLKTSNLLDREGARTYVLGRADDRGGGFGKIFNTIESVARGEGSYAAALEFWRTPSEQRNSQRMYEIAEEKGISISSMLSQISTKGVWRMGRDEVHAKLATLLPAKPTANVGAASHSGQSHSMPLVVTMQPEFPAVPQPSETRTLAPVAKVPSRARQHVNSMFVLGEPLRQWAATAVDSTDELSARAHLSSMGYSPGNSFAPAFEQLQKVLRGDVVDSYQVVKAYLQLPAAERAKTSAWSFAKMHNISAREMNVVLRAAAQAGFLPQPPASSGAAAEATQPPPPQP